MGYDVIVVGGGIAGLTSAAFLAKEGYKVLICEKEKKIGGLVNSFKYKGFTFDGGIRAIENSGIVVPMLSSLGLEVEFLNNNVSIGMDDEIISINSKESLEEFKALLKNKFPENTSDIDRIIIEIKKSMKYMDILYGIDNPMFMDFKKDKEYLYKTMLPWIFKFMFTINKINKLNIPIYQYLGELTDNKALIDFIGQHFFKDTPSSFALSYFNLYLDYKYPKGGTGTLVETLESFILENQGHISLETEICSIDTELKKVKDLTGNEYTYNKLIWASDQKKLYNNVKLDSIKNNSIKGKVVDKKRQIEDLKGGDSVFILFMAVNLDKSYFKDKCTEHCFYTASKKGLSSINIDENSILSMNKEELIKWMKQFYEHTTYEISIPVMRDNSLAPEGNTGLMVSVLMDYSIVKYISDMGWYEEFKKLSEQYILDTINNSIFPGIRDNIIEKFSSTPLTIENITGNSHGAITGWAFTNKFIPVEKKMVNIFKAVTTEIPDVFQAGQWTFSPSGLPISILTGKVVADKVKRRLKR